jgi:hypothetical protein
MKKLWSHRKGLEFERAMRRVLADVFGDGRVYRGGRVGGSAGPAPDVVAPCLVVECKAGKRTSLRPALRQAVRQARAGARNCR